MCGLGIVVSAVESTSVPTKVVTVLMGPPGSGKGTQAAKLSEVLSLPHVSTGDLFRENMKQNTELGKRARVFIEAGQLVPDQIVLDMLFDRVSRSDCAKGYILDGVPRTIPQAESLDHYLAKENINLLVLDLEVSDEVVVKRVAGRLSCKTCGRVYNQYFTPPKQEGKCDYCGSALIQRTDDKPEVVEERLRVYKEQTRPLLDYYRQKGLLKQVNGERGVDIVFQDLLESYKIHVTR
jgi:adenylate kinase